MSEIRTTAERLRADIERLLGVLRFIAQGPKAVSPAQAARDALADYEEQHGAE